MKEHKLRILHLSDLHARGSREKDAWRRRRVLGEAWAKNLDELVADGVAVDLVCFTGDVADWGKAEEYEQAGELFEAMLERLHVPKERFFVVPGNHDVNRKVNAQGWKKLRPLLLDVPPIERSRWLLGQYTPRGLKDAQREKVLERTAAYRTWLASFGRSALLPGSSPHGRLGYRGTVRVRDLPFDVHVIGLDSAWLCGDDADSSRLLLTEDQVARLGTTETGSSLPGFRLALVHHPLSDLRDGDACRSLLAEHVDLLLRGHLHREELAAWIGPGEALRQVAAGCLYEGELGNTWQNACHLFDITLDDEGRPRGYDVRLRGFSDAQSGFWFDNGGLYREAPSGRLRWRVSGASRSSSVPPPPPRIFVGRDDELRKLAETLLPASGEPKVAAVCAVQGMPGVGKSYLADKFASDYAADFPGGTYRLALAPDEQKTGRDLAGSWIRDLAERLRLMGAPNDLAVRVRQALRASRALVHLENVDGQDAANAAVFFARELRGCALIVTGRYQGLGVTPGWVAIPIDTFDEKTAITLLEAELGLARTQAEREARRRLVRELGGLPLALHLAAGYLRVGGYDADTFLAELRRRGLDMNPGDPGYAFFQGDSRRANLHHTFGISMDLLGRQLGAGAEPLLAGLRALGYAPSVGVGRSLGAAMAGLEAVDFSRLVDAAVRLSLLVRAPAEERADGAWRMHALLAEWMRRRVDEEVVTARMTEWFLERLPEEKQGEAWVEVGREMGALAVWLPRVHGEEFGRVVGRAMSFAIQNGPFHVWMEFCERGLQQQDARERSNLLWTLANVARSAGDLDRALTTAQQKEAHDKAHGADREAALAAGCRADILEARGELDEALRIRRQEVLPVFERLDDVRERAVTLGRIADVLEVRGELDEALRIRQQEQLPVFERLDDASSCAVTLGQIADILKARGEFDEALRIRQQEVLPVFERLGEVRERAVALGRIAAILQARGELDEALRIRQQEELPVYERLGEVRERLVCRANIAHNLLARNAPGDRDEAARLLRLAHADAERLRLPEAQQIRRIQQRHRLPTEDPPPSP
ncbi:metallophosphoesterase [Polyangium mundeleinium]|uniref:Metallophosphoesterase n=1 Tax=Polyangium mundeleinium TaxID=2995306 RepID=A0ABT5EVJ6_9BACT|nr:metallophosphoesterase [Polyangium mundeleinium]MDC0745394.1 metallophosphoesterase [Polyangium mundeleinium]